MKFISGVKQGCNVSRFLLILVLNWMMKYSVDGKNKGIRWKFTSKLEDLDFTDDTALLSSRYDNI